jgi:HK97 family phage prohead protease
MTETTTITFPVELRAASEGRTIEGIVVPWNETSMLTPHPRGERFLPGSLTRSVRERGAKVKLFRAHDHTTGVGRATRWDPGHERGLWGEFRIAQTPAGDAVLEEVREGMLDAFSVGFVAIKTRSGSDGAREVLEGRLHEVSLAPVAAYDGAEVMALRAPAARYEVPPMPVVNLDPIPRLHPY